MPITLFSIGSNVGTPLSLDGEKLYYGTFCMCYAINLVEELHDQIPIKRKGYIVFVNLDYENLPIFCNHCNCISHYIDKC